MAKAKVTEPITTLKELAFIAKDKCDGNWDDSTKYMIDRLKRSPSLLESLLDEILYVSCKYVVRQTTREVRQELEDSTRKAAHDVYVAPVSKRENAGGTMPHHLKPLKQLGWYDYELQGGLRLAQATKKDVLAHAAVLEKMGRGCFANARWLRDIGDKMPEDKLIGEVFSEEEILEMRTKAFKS